MTDSSPLDWIHPPAGIEEMSLWTCLHDARVVSAIRDPVARTLTLEIECWYLRDTVERILFRFAGVQSLRAIAMRPSPEGVDRATAVWLEKSVSWDSFAEPLARASVEISDASLLERDGVALRLVCFRRGDASYRIFVRAERLTLVAKNGDDIGIRRLIALGDAYWERFENRGATE